MAGYSALIPPAMSRDERVVRNIASIERGLDHVNRRKLNHMGDRGIYSSCTTMCSATIQTAVAFPGLGSVTLDVGPSGWIAVWAQADLWVGGGGTSEGPGIIWLRVNPLNNGWGQNHAKIMDKHRFLANSTWWRFHTMAGSPGGVWNGKFSAASETNGSALMIQTGPGTITVDLGWTHPENFAGSNDDQFCVGCRYLRAIALDFAT